MLIDTQSQANITHVKDYISSLGVSKFDYVVITHYHGDHAGNIGNLKQFFNSSTKFYIPQDVNRAKVPSSVASNEDLTKNIIAEVGATYLIPTENQIITLPNGVKLEFVNTVHTSYYASSSFDYNNCSLCFYFKVNNNEMFFSSDIGLEAQEFLRTKVRPVEIYKAHHHSSDKFLNNRFMYSIFPSMCICMDSNETYYDLIGQSSLQNWLQSNNIPIYPTSRNGDIILEVNEADYYISSKCQAYVRENKFSEFFNSNYIKQYAYQDFTDIISGYTNVTTLKEIVDKMSNGTQVQTTISKSHASCPSFISTYGAYIEIYKDNDYSRIVLTDRNPQDSSLYIGKSYKDDSTVSFIKFSQDSESKYRTAGANYNKNVETIGTIIADYTNNSNGLYILESGKIKILKGGKYKISISIVSDIKYADSEVRANVYHNNNLLTSAFSIASTKGYTYASNFIISTFSPNDLISVKFNPITEGSNSVNISSSIYIEEV